MPDVNNYANDLLLDFYDAAHAELSRVLQKEFGANWIAFGVREHFKPDYFDRVSELLASPMRRVNMARAEDELFGVEHLWNIVNGNWPLFKETFENKNRTQVYLSEITELRNNLAHRKKRHVLLRSDLIRTIGSCQVILSALRSPRAETFAAIVDTLSSGGTPWGAILEGYLPPSDEMYAEFVGRPSELDGLSDWLASDSPQILVWGYGGVGKSALAYKFAREIRDSSNETLIAVCWVSAKKSEFSEGSERDRPADFADLPSFVKALWTAMYGPSELPSDLEPDRLLNELNAMPILLVVDDFDTISEDVELTEFLLYKLRGTPTRVIYTSRHRIPTLQNREVPPFSGNELRDFVSRRAVDYSVDQSTCLKRLKGIKSVTGGYPLFVDDLIHHAAFVGIDGALKDWSQRKGDAARQYALHRQIEYLSHSSGEVLIALSVANRALRLVEISAVGGLTDDDAQAGIGELLRWRMVNQVKEDDSESPVFRMNNNTSRLVKQTFRDDRRMKTFSGAFRALTGERVPEAKKIAIAKIVSQTMELVRVKSSHAAEEHLVGSMTGELADSPDLFGVLGRLLSERQPLNAHAQMARDAFERSHKLGSSKFDTYYHWAIFERRLAEALIANATAMNITDNAIADQWKACEDVAVRGVERCGPSQPLFYFAGYGASREAKARSLAKSFLYAEGAYTRSIDWFNRALAAPVSDIAPIPRGLVYRGMTLAYEGLGDEDGLQRTLKLWHASSRSEHHFERECRRLLQKYHSLRNVPEFGPVWSRPLF